MADTHSALLKIVREGDDMTMRQMCVLLGCRDKVRTVRDLSEELNVAKPAITRAADRLEEAALLRRKKDPEDRRSVLLEITASGRKLADRFKG